MPEISVIVPVYNVEKYLDHCVQSIVEQTFTDLEVWLVDDGSSDASPALCDAWAAKDPRIRVIHKKNGGASDARNAGLDACTGAYIAFVDSDDYIAPEMLQTLYAEAQRTGADIVMSNANRVDDAGKAVWADPAKYFAKAEILDEDGYWRYFDSRYTGTLISPCMKLYKHKVLSDLRYPKGIAVSEDYYIAPDIAKRCQVIAILPYVGYYYGFHAGSLTNTPLYSNQPYHAMADIHHAAYFRSRGWYGRAETSLTAAAQVLAKNKSSADFAVQENRTLYRKAKHDLTNEFHLLARDSKNPSLRVRSLALRLGLPVFFWYDALVKRLKNR